MPYTYTNRQGKTYYIRAAETKKGGVRYYLTASADFPDLIDEVPTGFEVAELPEDARVVIRKRVPVLVTQEEKEIVQDAIAEFSAIKDFFIHAERDTLFVYHSQFNHTGGQEENLSREEAKAGWGAEIERWMKFDTALKFVLADKAKRLFQAERVVFTSAYGFDFHPIGQPGQIEDVAREFGQHLGRPSFFEIDPVGWEE